MIRNFDEGLWARVRTDDGEHSVRFGVTQGLRQGCVLSPLLVSVSFAAALRVGVLYCSKDENIIRGWVHLNDAGVVGTAEQEPLACVGRAVKACCKSMTQKLSRSRLKGSLK